MPILIQEIVITAVVGPDDPPLQDSDPHSADRDEWVEACVAETMKIQRQKSER